MYQKIVCSFCCTPEDIFMLLVGWFNAFNSGFVNEFGSKLHFSLDSNLFGFRHVDIRVHVLHRGNTCHCQLLAEFTKKTKLYWLAALALLLANFFPKFGNMLGRCPASRQKDPSTIDFVAN